MRNKSHVRTVVDKTSAHAVWTWGKTLFFEQQCVPEYVFGKWFFCVSGTTVLSSAYGPNEDLLVRVWTPRWRPPMVMDATMTLHSSVESGKIVVMHRKPGPVGDFYVKRMIERVLRPGCPTADVSTAVVAKMADMWHTSSD